MGGTKRTRVSRLRSPPFDAETLALFVDLEAAPPRRGESDGFKAQDKELHQRLGLWGERLCSQVSVLDRREEHHRPGSPQAADFKRVRRVRLALLEAAKEGGLPTSTDRPRTDANRRLNA
jgi:hypothetical protein